MSEQSTPAEEEAAAGLCLVRAGVALTLAKCCHFGGNKNIFLTTAWKKCRRHRIRTCLAGSCLFRFFGGAGKGRGHTAAVKIPGHWGKQDIFG